MDDFQKTGFSNILNTFCQLSPLLIVFVIVVIAIPCICAKLILPLIPGISDTVKFNILLVVVMICLFIYIFNALFVPHGKKDDTTVFLLLLPNKFYNDGKYIAQTILFELQKDKNAKFFFPNFLARCFANYAFSKHHRHKLLSRFYEKYFCFMSKADIAVCGKLNEETKDGNKICVLKLFFLKRDAQNPNCFGKNPDYEEFEIDLENTKTAFEDAIEAIKEEVNLLKEKEKTS